MNRQQRRAAQRQQPTKSEINKLAKDADAKGCSKCGNHFAQGLPYFVIRHDDELRNCCGTCLLTEATPPVFAAMYIGGGDPWAADDREWFKNHSRRSYRLRAPWPGELESATLTYPEQRTNGVTFVQKVADSGLRLAIVVHQMEPGKRVRSMAGVPGDDPFESYTDAGIIRLIPGSGDLGQGIVHAGGCEAVWNDQMKRRLAVTADVLETIGVKRTD